MKRVNVISIGGSNYVLPEDMSTKERTQLAAALLQLQVLDHEYDKDYKSYRYVTENSLSVSFSAVEVYDSEGAAEDARDARNVVLNREKESSTT
jgi:hypothetical protein